MIAKIKKIIVKILSVGADAWNRVFGSMEYDKFVVVTRSRTGSNFLITSLNSHPHIVAQREMFRELNGKSCAQVWNNIFSKKPGNVKFVGFKIFYYHPLDSEDRSVWNELLNDKSIKIIHLKRTNLLRTVVSGKIAQKTKIWTNKGPHSKLSLEDKKLTLEANECIQEFKKTRDYEAKADEMFRDHKKITVYYEELVSDPQVLTDVMSFLGVEHRSLQTEYRKQNKESLQDLIENYHDFSNKLKQTEWSYLLE